MVFVKLYASTFSFLTWLLMRLDDACKKLNVKIELTKLLVKSDKSTKYDISTLTACHFSKFQIIADYWKLRCTQRETKQLISGIIFFFLGNSETDFWPIKGQGYKNVINCPLHAIVARRNFWCNLVQVKPRNLNFFSRKELT